MYLEINVDICPNIFFKNINVYKFHPIGQLRNFDDRFVFLLDHALPSTVINRGADISELVGRHTLPLAGTAQDNPSDFIRVHGNLASHWDYKVWIIIFFVVFKWTLILYFMAQFFEKWD